MNSETFVLYGGVNVEITLTELPDGTLQFDLSVLDDTGAIGDLNAFFFDLADDSLTSGITITGNDVTETALKVDGVTKIDNFTNMNGEVIRELGKFDGGVQFGTAGIGEDDIRQTSFVLSHETSALTLEDLSLQDIGVRLTSVGAEGGAREDSLKIGGTAPELTSEPPAPLHTANADEMTVMEFETFNPPGVGGDPLANLVLSVLDNDTTDTFQFTGTVATVAGSAENVGQIVLGNNGGAVVIFADGTVDFSAASVPFGASDFAYLEEGQSAQTTFEYGIEGGSVATLTVTVLGISSNDGGGSNPDGLL